MTVLMKIELVGPRRRGLALGLNESAGYLGVAAAALLSGALAATNAPRAVIWVGGLVVATAGLIVSAPFVRDTGDHESEEQRAFGEARASSLRAAFARGTVRDQCFAPARRPGW